jgi:hypothetical protein
MKIPLEEDVERLTQFDDWRVKAARMRDAGRTALADSYKDENRKLWEPESELRPTESRQAPRTEILEYAAVLRAVLAHHRTNWIEPPRFLIDRLESVTAGEVMDPSPDEVPVLRAAKAMCAMALTPNSAFSSSVMIFYYYIIRALYVIDAPEWSTGGARAGDSTVPSAYVTWQCIRAIVGFQRALLNTAMLLGNLASIVEQREERFSESIPEAWRRIDAGRGAIELDTCIKAVRDNIALALTAPGELAQSITVADIDAKVVRICEELKNELTERRDGFLRAWRRIDLRRRAWVKLMESKGAPREMRRNVRLQTAHGIALEAVQNAATRADAAIGTLNGSDPPARKLRDLQKQFEEAARYTVRIMAPATTYVSHVLDRELASAAASSSEFWDPTEMAFAAVAFGEAKQRWDDERLARAARHLGTRISERGVFPFGQAIHASDRGYQLHPLNTDVIRAFARVLQHVQSVDLDPEVVRRMLSYLQDTQEKPGFWRVTPWRGWRQRTTTASAVLALDAINEMLDERINGIVLGHFSVRRPEDLTVTLPDLFYPDYGMVGAPAPIGRDASVAVLLERLRAHVIGVEPPSYEPLFSLVLHGPPGTGKTTLVEALAKSCKVPLVEVTPSDIVIGGEDAIERRTRAVFKALSLLTRTVILFDEFDPVLLERKPEETQRNVFTFLTPGMLPKLKTLHDNAARRGVAYVLITNLVAKLDAAAIRNGRFDARLGIYSPDVLSRAGRIRSVIARYKRQQAEKGNAVPDPSPEDIWTVVKEVVGGPMNTIGRPGWFTAPDKISNKESNAFSFLYAGVPLKPPAPEKPRELADARRAAKPEYLEWSWVDLWDETAALASDAADALSNVPDKAAVDEEYNKALRDLTAPPP